MVEELFEDCLDSLLREDDEFFALADSLMDEIECRFDLLKVGELEKTTQGWREPGPGRRVPRTARPL